MPAQPIPSVRLENLSHGSHSCFIYETPEQQAKVTAQFLKIGLDRLEKCVFLERPERLDLVRQALQELGVDAAAAESKGALVLSAARDYLEGGHFDRRRTIGFLEQALNDALAAGFTALRATGDMNWELGDDQDFQLLIAYETELDSFVQKRKIVGLCQYQHATVSAGAIQNALETHRTVVLGDLLCTNNLFYQPAEIKQESDLLKKAQIRAHWMCQRLQQAMEAENERDGTQRETLERYQMMVEEIKDYAVYMLDPKGIITTWNVGAERIKGYAAEEVIGKHFSMFYAPEDLRDERPRRLLERALLDGRVEDETWRVRKNGARFWANVIITALYDQNGDLRGFAKVTRDLTERHTNEESLRHKDRELMQTRKIEAVGRLAGGIAHDFNNLLTGILGCSEILASNLGNDRTNIEEVTEIQKAAGRAMALTKQLLAFGRRQTIAAKPLSLNAVIMDLMSMLRRLLQENVHLNSQLDPALDVLQADRSQMEQIILNLVLNARDAMPQGGTITVATGNVDLPPEMALRLETVPGPYVTLSVSDTGTGMTPEVRAKLFEPFFTTKKEGVGTGLGLATVHGIVKQNRGAIMVESEEGHGSQFRIWLPSLRDAPTPQNFSQIPTQNTQAIPHGSETILVVEDEEIVANYAAKILRGLGYKVLVAHSAAEATRLSESRETNIDLLLTDVVLPESNGQEVARQILPVFPGAKVLYMSGYPADIIAQHGVLEPGIAFLEKPFNAAQLGAKIRDVLGLRQPTIAKLEPR